MQTAQFPMVLVHRSNPHAQIVVANADQLAEVGDEYQPLAATLTAAAAIPGVNLDVANADLTDRQKSLESAVDEFSTHVETEMGKLDAERAQIRADRAALEQQTAGLNEQLEALARERAYFEQQRTIETSGAPAGTDETPGDTGTASAAAEGAATGEATATPAAPAKRTRGAAKAEG